MYFLYNLILIFGVLISWPYWLGLILFTPKYRANFAQRLGYYPLELVHRLQGKRPIWLHAVSVGETMAALLIVKQLKAQHPEVPILISTVTVTGNQIAQQNEKYFDGIIYFPLDFPWIVKKALHLFQPQLVMIMETELWPNFLRECNKSKIPSILINGRLSDKSVHRYRKVKPFMAKVTSSVTYLLMQSNVDAERMLSIGAPQKQVQITGNIKFDITPPHLSNEDLYQWRAIFGLNDTSTPVFVAGSTHPGEEEQILEAYKNILNLHSMTRLILVPRHPERANEVEKIIQEYGFTSVRRSSLTPNSIKNNPIILVDTVGELMNIFMLADVAFIGGSLVSKGGHNVLEPAALKKPVLFGPFMNNFRESAQLLLESGGGIQVQNAQELAKEVTKLLKSNKESIRLGEKAASAVTANAGAVKRTLDTIYNYLN